MFRPFIRLHQTFLHHCMSMHAVILSFLKYDFTNPINCRGSAFQNGYVFILYNDIKLGSIELTGNLTLNFIEFLSTFLKAFVRQQSYAKIYRNHSMNLKIRLWSTQHDLSLESLMKTYKRLERHDLVVVNKLFTYINTVRTPG